MARALILAIDQGTTNTKALLIDAEGQTVFRASASLDLLQPQPGYVEQDPLALWQSVCRVVADCVRYSKSHEATVAAIAISNQRETAVTWRDGGEPVGNAITWQCRRSAPVCERLREQAAVIQAVSGLPLDPLLSATKWAWVLEQRPELRNQAVAGKLRLGTVDSWLLYKLTGGRVHATDTTNASRTALLSLASLEWDDKLLALFGIPRAALPELKSSSGIFAECAAIPELAGVPIASMIGDSHAALVGHGCYEAGTVKATYGTGSSLMMLTPGLVAQTKVLARTVAWSAPDDVRFALEGNIAMSGAAVQWVGEFLSLAHPAEGAAALAATVSDAAGVMLVPAMVGLGAPHWDASARGLVANLERSHTAAHLARAAVDAIAFQVADVLEAMERAAGVDLPVLLADGGATRNGTLMQMQADIIGRPVHRSTQDDLSALGAAMLAGMAIGWWKSLEQLAALPKDADVFEPRMSAAQREKLRDSWRLAVQRARLREPGKEGSQTC
ncbi:MAG TPA: glycerol kinase GlpK [Terracidiphilus sp.]|nr:glycerol kinase GlpK [Terracidiphilus sp.]